MDASSNEHLLNITQTLISNNNNNNTNTINSISDDYSSSSDESYKSNDNSNSRYVLKKIKPKCKYLPKYNFGSFIEDKLHALSPVTMEDDVDDKNEDEEIFSSCFESSLFSS
jgi:hypothetical protein